MKLFALSLFLCVACSGGIGSIPVPTSGSVTVTDAGATVCTTIPLEALRDAGAGK